jgi:hypothetical protein
MIAKTLAVIIQTEDDEYYQVALTTEMAAALFTDLKNLYFSDNTVKVLPQKIEGIKLVGIPKIIDPSEKTQTFNFPDEDEKI